MSEHFRAFFHSFYPQEVITERAQIIRDLTDFVRQGLKDPYERSIRGHMLPANVAELTFIASVDAAMFNQSAEQIKLTKAQRARINTGDTHQMVIDAFKQANDYQHRDLLSEIPFRDEALNDAFKTAFPRALSSQWIWKESDWTVRGAFDRALSNLARTDTRLLCFSVLHKLLRRNERDNVQLLASDQVREALYIARNRFQTHMLVFGGLAGGFLAARAVQLAARQMVYNPDADINYSIIEYMTVDGMCPSSWSGRLEKELRENIKIAYEALE